ncbi:MAG: tRNA (adenine-N1)-methyltransferase, partial [Bifidobacteriaceae bacterium]|nr:tRNA (adenine-N1)-methyltransferase [Bifidobacteriaceae bacterium]
EHRMVAHTGFLARTRRLAPGVAAPERRRRPAPGAYDAAGLEWTPESVGERQVSDRKIRRVRRSLNG